MASGNNPSLWLQRQAVVAPRRIDWPDGHVVSPGSARVKMESADPVNGGSESMGNLRRLEQAETYKAIIKSGGWSVLGAKTSGHTHRLPLGQLGGVYTHLILNGRC
jgi:hypothetical protein